MTPLIAISHRLDRAKAARMDFGTVAGPALVIAGGCDRIVPGRLARRNAARYRDAPRSRHREP